MIPPESGSWQKTFGIKTAKIASDCIKTLYEVGYLKPELIAPYVGDFLKLIKSRENRLVWGGMLALSTIAALKSGRHLCPGGTGQEGHPGGVGDHHG